MSDVFIQELLKFLNPEEVLSQSESLTPYNQNTFPNKNKTHLIIKPDPKFHQNDDLSSLTAMSKKILEAAKAHKMPIHPISKGKNWGYGSATPPSDHCSILDLSNFNNISNYDAVNGTITVEPGVTQIQLYEFLIAQGDKHLMDATGGPTDASVLGNNCERGFGHTPKGDHFRNIITITAVIPLGLNESPIIEKSGFSKINNAKAANVYEYGVGAYTVGMFTQSNWAIICNMTIRLMLKPEYFQAFFIQFSNEHIEEIIDKFRQLKQQGILESSVHIGNSHKAVQLILENEKDGENPLNFPLANEEYQRLQKKYNISDWTLSGAFYGSKQLAKSKLSELKKGISATPYQLFLLDHKKLVLLKKLTDFLKNTSIGKLVSSVLGHFYFFSSAMNNLNMLKNLEELFYLKQGKPSDHFINSIYFRKNIELNEDYKDPNSDNVGLIWLAPVASIEGHRALEIINLVSPVITKFGFEPTFSITLLTETSMDVVISLIYDRDLAEEDERAMVCYNKLIELLAEHGYYLYRHSRVENPINIAVNHQSNDFTLKLKNTLDPLNIISPGHYIN